MDGFPSAQRFARVPSFRRFSYLVPALVPRARSRLICGIGACLLLALAGSVLLLWADSPLTTAQAASTCPISSLPPTPTSAQPANPTAIKFNELLSAPKLDWNCDGKNSTADQWIELTNTSGSDADLSGFQLLSQGSNNDQPVLLPLATRIAAHSYLVIFDKQLPQIQLFPGGGTLELLDANGQIADAINYPALGTDQSYARASNGQWSISGTPTPGKANSFGSGSTPTPKATATKRSGGGSGGGSRPTATPTPIGSIVLPTDTPSGGVALQNADNNTSGGAGGSDSQGVPSWLKIALIALIGTALLAVIIWYLRTWNQEPEGDA
jgi:hypothetical protein